MICWVRSYARCYECVTVSPRQDSVTYISYRLPQIYAPLLLQSVQNHHSIDVKLIPLFRIIHSKCQKKFILFRLCWGESRFSNIPLCSCCSRCWTSQRQNQKHSNLKALCKFSFSKANFSTILQPRKHYIFAPQKRNMGIMTDSAKSQSAKWKKTAAVM